MSSNSQCTAKSKASGERCRRSPVPGADVCFVHGGAAPQVRAKGRERMLERRIRAEVAGQTIEPVTDPVAWLTWTAGEVRAWHEACARHVDDLNRLIYTDDRGVEDVVALVALFERSLDRTVATAAKMTQLGLDASRLQANAERPTREQAEAFSRILDHLLADLGLTDDQRAQVPAALAAAISKEGLL